MEDSEATRLEEQGADDLAVTLPALDSGVYLRENKLLFSSSHLYFGFWIQNLIPERGMLQIPSKM